MVGQAPDHLNREHPRTACSPDLGGPWAGAPARLSPISPSHRLSPLKVSAFFKRTFRPPGSPGGRFFAQSGAHLFAVLCANRRTFPKTSRTAPICCIFLQQTPSFSPMGERPFSHPPTPSHDRESPHKHSQLAVQGAPNRECYSRQRTSVSNRLVSTPLGGLSEHTPEHSAAAYARLSRGDTSPPLGADPGFCTERLLRAGPGSIREPLLQASRALRPPASGLSFHPPINRDRTLKAAYPAREPAQVAIIFVAFLQNPAKQPPFLCETKIFCKISSF